ncbi:hypothetical protein NDN08_007846 [Rhodosorus marinus]|uniref:C2H2-type domain-containing protein n=1 Tax=Rhodosorus marinus TaxID=101924 RepID=A0AAV8UYR1_9RHOD|nr:hypothetical protein NDN08_007846 [Rhodosorus marinus]
MTRQGLKEHQRTHTLETPYTCRYDCGRSFRWRSSLAHHEKTAHGGPERSAQLDYDEMKDSSMQNTTGERSPHQGEHEQGAGIESMELDEIDEERTRFSLSEDLAPHPPPLASSTRTEGPVDTGRRSFDGMFSYQKRSVTARMVERSQQETFPSSRPTANAAPRRDESPIRHAGRRLARMSSAETLPRTQLEEPVAEWLRTQRRTRSLKLGRKISWPSAQGSEVTMYSNTNGPAGSRQFRGEREEAEFDQVLASLLTDSQQVEETSKSEFQEDSASTEKSPWNSP